jgi:hypothetical protein
MKGRICVVTGSRAEYGLLRNLIKLIQNDSDFLLQVIVTGSHLLEENGFTYREIESDGIDIDFKVEILPGFVDEIGALEAMGIAQVEIQRFFPLSNLICWSYLVIDMKFYLRSCQHYSFKFQ